MTDIILTSLGKIKGKRSKSRINNKPLFFFRSIPYAKPPIGDLRFALPEPIESWPGTLDCSNKESKPCLQVNVMSPESKFFLGSEDCLYLNVYTPQIPGAGKSVKLPVIVFLHGGAFCVGSNDSKLYGPGYLLDDGNVVLVTVNYRLGPLGFFSLNCDSAPGNQGCHDQVLALQWVQDHIAHFGGDKDNVTLFGESAGGMAALMHLVSPLSQGLFHKIISMSASVSTPFLHNDRDPSIYAKQFAQDLGANPDDPTEKILKILRRVPAKSIVERTPLFKDWDVSSPMPWKPVVDSFASRPFMPRKFIDMVKLNDYCKDVPIMVGTNTEEGLIISTPFHKSEKKWDLLFNNWEVYAPQMLFHREADLVTNEDITRVNKVREKFFGNQEPHPPWNEKNLRKLEQICSTNVFHAPLARDLKLLLDSGCSKIFQYSLSYQGSMTMADLFRLSPMKLILNFSGRHTGFRIYQKKLGVCHGDELFYIFPFTMGGFPNPLKTENDAKVCGNILRLITNFAKDGHPTPKNVTWQEYSYEENNILNISTEISMSTGREDKISKRVEFWNKSIYSESWASAEPVLVPVPKLHNAIVEKRNLVIDAAQLFS